MQRSDIRDGLTRTSPTLNPGYQAADRDRRDKSGDDE